MKFVIQWEKGDRVVDPDCLDAHPLGAGGIVVATDYYASDDDWVEVKWDRSVYPTWVGRGTTLDSEKALPVPPKFASQAEADAWLEANG